MKIKSDIYFEVVSYLNKNISITKNYWNKIVQTKHKIIKGKEENVKKALIEPEEIRISKKDSTVFLYYKKINKHYICVVVKHLNGDGFIITTYITSKIKIGKKYETNKNIL